MQLRDEGQKTRVRGTKPKWKTVDGAGKPERRCTKGKAPEKQHSTMKPARVEGGVQKGDESHVVMVGGGGTGKRLFNWEKGGGTGGGVKKKKKKK